MKTKTNKKNDLKKNSDEKNSKKVPMEYNER